MTVEDASVTVGGTKPEPLTSTRSSLLRRVSDPGDADGWREFDKLYRPMLIDYARARGLPQEAAEEIAQQCLAAMVTGLQRFERRRSFRGWLRGMVDHKVADWLAECSRHRRADTQLLADTSDSAPSPDELWAQRWDEAHLRHLVEHLRTNFAAHNLQAFWLYVLDERPVDEISKRLGMTPNQIYVAKARVVRCLRERFSQTLDTLYGGLS